MFWVYHCTPEWAMRDGPFPSMEIAMARAMKNIVLGSRKVHIAKYEKSWWIDGNVVWRYSHAQ